MAALPCALGVLVFPTPSVNPTARSEGFVSASAHQDRMAKTLAPAVPSVLVAEDSVSGSAIGPTPAPTGPGLAFSSANAFSNRTRHASVCGPKPTQPLQPGVAPNIATTLVVKNTRGCPDGPWSSCVTIVAFKFSALPFQGSPLADLESLFRWHAVQQSCFLDSILL